MNEQLSHRSHWNRSPVSPIGSVEMRTGSQRMQGRNGIGMCALLGALVFCIGPLSPAIAQTSQTTQYGYDAQGRLSTVTNPDSTTSQYLYENASFPNALTGLLDESTTRFSSWGYDTQGRATSTSEAGGAGATTLVYNADNSVTVTDALGAVRTFTFGRYGDRNLVTGITGSQCPTCSEPKATTYDLAGFLSSRTD